MQSGDLVQINPLLILACVLFFYFFFLIVATFFRSYLTIRGIFWGLIITLVILVCLLAYLFSYIFLKHATFWWEALIISTTSATPEIGINIYLDVLAYLFVLLVSIIGLVTNIYILNYFKNEANEDIFILLINWFILSMILLVLANNLFTLFLGWELIGLTSFFLINFWNERRGTLKASFKAFIFNKISDFFLLIFIILLWHLTSKSNILLINLDAALLVKNNSSLTHLCGICLIVCASIKSAQILGHLWLPDSMEAPVPASALIHSATLVSAGVYLLLRFNPLIFALNFQFIIITLGAITAAYGGIVAAAQTDVKKLLAYSTISHCGFLFICTSFGNHYLVIIYLFLHGLFKAMTFFCVGSLIRVANSQDTRRMGILSRLVPVDTIFLIISAGNLGGLPFTLGYLYKNLFLLHLVSSTFNFFIVGLCFVGMLSSIVYVYRLVYYSVFDINKGYINETVKYLQDNITVDKNVWSFSSILQSISIFLLLGFTLYLYILFFSYYSFSNLTFDHFPLFFESDSLNIKISEEVHKSYIHFFYILYVAVISILVVVECRRSYSFIYKFHFLLFLLLFFFFLTFAFCM